ncbi:MAG: tyrosine--tRNA ligase [Flavobacteriales bacterium AspAUS03]
MKDLLDELSWRGLLYNKVPGIEAQLEKGSTTFYVGFDPTANSLHVGSLVPILMLVHFQRAGHKPLVLVGGATGMIGDPSDKSTERNLLDENTLQKNIAGIQAQLACLLDFKSNAAELVNNYDWMKSISFLDFAREIGKHVTVNYMMAKDSVKKRLSTEAREGMSFTEFTYQLLQGYDFLHLYQAKNCLLQVGGSDQWGNITTGIELIRRKMGHTAYGLTFPLIIKPDGNKFGKTEKGENIWLDPEQTSPYQFYQFWMNVSDVDTERFIKIYTFLSRADIEALITVHRQAPHQRLLQQRLATELTTWVHGQATCKKVVQVSQLLFGHGTIEALKVLDEVDFLSFFEGVPQTQLSREDLQTGLSIIDALVQKGRFLSSNSEARRALKERAIAVNKQRVDETFVLSMVDLIANRYLLLQRGKKQYFIIKVL